MKLNTQVGVSMQHLQRNGTRIDVDHVCNFSDKEVACGSLETDVFSHKDSLADPIQSIKNMVSQDSGLLKKMTSDLYGKTKNVEEDGSIRVLSNHHAHTTIMHSPDFRDTPPQGFSEKLDQMFNALKPFNQSRDAIRPPQYELWPFVSRIKHQGFNFLRIEGGSPKQHLELLKHVAKLK